ncbi:cytochrome b561 domain-containing protein [Bordetella holmesii]|nr:cytochrome b561 domain-containing protein [Bordetella holmesii]AIT26303.1 eukaryotic cytochrome b561 family protein [Bordetella holmesii 44057]EWM44265.1 eukaryotic cytochrome b561 family protein [Bordetella holmesii 41130]AMD45345.1 cytochrome B [Bordetella holmesii H558]AOB34232.1 cytochrome B [Bordetella holmesii]AUL18249.1 cytochrome B [Bordetella holmesii]
MFADALQWLVMPISGAADHAVSASVSWHGRTMSVAWGGLVPIAILVARFFKVTRRQRWPQELDNKFWWHVHRGLNYSAVALACVGAYLVWGAEAYAGSVRALHGWLGWSIVDLGVAQALGGQLRGSKGGPTDPRRDAQDNSIDLRGDHYDMTARRVWFERVHKAAGYTALTLSAITVLLGMWVADAPRWMWLGLSIWWSAFVYTFVWLQRHGRCLDTYQAIWGPELTHPGNALPVVGVGIQRFPPCHASEITQEKP